MVGNGFCNDETNNADCNYDGGDCCVMNANPNSCSECVCHLIETCAAGYHPWVGNGFCNDETNIAECNYDSGDCCGYSVNSEHCTECTCFYQETCLAGVTHAFVGDGICNDETNIVECDYDGGDCCPNPNLVGNGNCNDVTNNLECTYDGGDCCPNPNMVGDAICHAENNHLGCNYDGGDCCLIIRISLTNEVLNAGYGYNRDYEISILPNGQTSWISGDYAIWYIELYGPGPVVSVWNIGNLHNIGEQIAFMYAYNDFHGLTDDENEWNYWTGSSWTSPIDPTDIQITCVNE